AITLDRYLSDHMPILLREKAADFGPILFRFFHHWFEIDGFSKPSCSSLGDIVDEVQSAFIAGRQILDGPFILNEEICLSHLFYADDAVFVGQWSDGNINTLMHVLDCFHYVSGLKINMSKSKIMGLYVDDTIVYQAASKLGCLVLNSPFLYLGTKVEGAMSHVQA
nr:RNA-directed DNA polymerase, eukaryota [Tanacetum cinerariifolium]